MEKIVNVEIAGRTYYLGTEEDEEYAKNLADFVSARILEIKRSSGASSLDCATIAAFQLADELHKALSKKDSKPSSR
ncbi:MAG TPA: cell division protein ZapA [Clostridiales bacterium]|jgi:cell division protein ZapA (FtsZ GTPase activity inhibitor)|nr:cell division protein ZapA [Clostridiales bacterium]